MHFLDHGHTRHSLSVGPHRKPVAGIRTAQVKSDPEIFLVDLPGGQLDPPGLGDRDILGFASPDPTSPSRFEGKDI